MIQATLRKYNTDFLYTLQQQCELKFVILDNRTISFSKSI